MMKRVKWCLFLVLFSLFCVQTSGRAETMYVTDRLYLSLRSVPDTEEPAMELLRSNTKVDVLTTKGNWAEVKLEDGRTGWVMKRFLIEEMPKALIIKEREGQLMDKEHTLERLREENASLKRQMADQDTFEEKEDALRQKIETMEREIAMQYKRLEMASVENAQKRLKGISVTGIVTLFVGIMSGYLVGRQRKKRLSSTYS